MATTSPMSIQQAHDLLKQLVNAADSSSLRKTITDNVMWCDGVFFAELEKLIEEFKRRGDETSAQKMQEVGDLMARLRFMI